MCYFSRLLSTLYFEAGSFIALMLTKCRLAGQPISNPPVATTPALGLQVYTQHLTLFMGSSDSTQVPVLSWHALSQQWHLPTPT